MDSLWQRLSCAQTFVEIATIVCVELRARFALSQCSVTLHGPDGKPQVSVDSVPERADPRDHRLALPLVQTAGVIGMIVCGSPAGFGDAERRDLEATSVRVSVRLAELGITSRRGARLSPRQYAVAELVARGFSNLEVASALAISANTVKKRLKEVYRRLDIANRTELVRELPPALDAGATGDVEGVTITRARVASR